MAQDKVHIPSGSGGIVRYFDEYKSKLEFKPGHIIILSIAVIIIMLVLYKFGKGFLGL